MVKDNGDKPLSGKLFTDKVEGSQHSKADVKRGSKDVKGKDLRNKNIGSKEAIEKKRGETDTGVNNSDEGQYYVEVILPEDDNDQGGSLESLLGDGGNDDATLKMNDVHLDEEKSIAEVVEEALSAPPGTNVEALSPPPVEVVNKTRSPGAKLRSVIKKLSKEDRRLVLKARNELKERIAPGLKAARKRGKTEVSKYMKEVNIKTNFLTILEDPNSGCFKQELAHKLRTSAGIAEDGE